MAITISPPRALVVVRSPRIHPRRLCTTATEDLRHFPDLAGSLNLPLTTQYASAGRLATKRYRNTTGAWNFAASLRIWSTVRLRLLVQRIGNRSLGAEDVNQFLLLQTVDSHQFDQDLGGRHQADTVAPQRLQ